VPDDHVSACRVQISVRSSQAPRLMAPIAPFPCSSAWSRTPTYFVLSICARLTTGPLIPGELALHPTRATQAWVVNLRPTRTEPARRLRRGGSSLLTADATAARKGPADACPFELGDGLRQRRGFRHRGNPSRRPTGVRDSWYRKPAQGWRQSPATRRTPRHRSRSSDSPNPGPKPTTTH